MGKHFFAGMSALVMAVTFFSGCSGLEENLKMPGTATVEVTEIVSDDPLLCKVLMTPSENTVSYRYGIGNEEDCRLFGKGQFSGAVEIEGNKPEEVVFEELDSRTEYMVFAQAKDEKGTYGEIYIHRILTVDTLFKAKAQYVTDRSFGVELSLSNNYQVFEYYLGTEADREAFAENKLETSSVEEISSKRFILNFFDLQPASDYVFYVRGYDRFGMPSQYREVAFSTLDEGNCPAVNMEIKHLDVYKGEFRLTANEKCGSFSAFICERGVNDVVIYNDMNWQGDMITMMRSWENIGDATFCKEGTLDMEYVMYNLETDFNLEMYVLAYDESYEPFGIYHYEFATPAYNENAVNGTVEIEVKDITETGATYIYRPEKLFAFMFETVDADWYDDIKENSGEWNETYLHNLLYNSGQYFAYCRDLENGELSYTESTGQSGVRYYAAACPMNENGIKGGWLPEVLVAYTTK